MQRVLQRLIKIDMEFMLILLTEKSPEEDAKVILMPFKIPAVLMSLLCLQKQQV